MKSGWNPTRRNRNIGTKKSGYSKQNFFYIPVKTDSIILNNVNTQVTERINGVEISFIIERLAEGYTYCCTIEEIVKILSFISQKDLDGLRFIIFKQPSKKEEILRPCWGRFIYDFSFNKTAGAAILLYAINIEKEIVWRNSLKIEGIHELEKLKKEGHQIKRKGRFIFIKSSLNSMKITQLYRTLFHEIGHLVDWMNFNRAHSNKGADLLSLYLKSPVIHREEFANSYAAKIKEKLLKAELIPL